jgi:two-component system, LytTR family, sensor kinase
MSVSLTRYLSQHRIAGFLLITLLVAIVIWSLDGLAYFLLMLQRGADYANPATVSDSQVRTFLILMPMISALLNAVLVTYLIITFRKDAVRKMRPVRRWLLFSAAIFTGSLGINAILYSKVIALFGGKTSSVTHLEPGDLLYSLSSLIAGSLFYYLLTREYRRSKKISEQQYELLLLKELKTKAELEALQAKINPHFLYNALNSIASLVHLDPDKAERMVLLLSKFFRYSTSVSNRHWSTVAGELEMVSTYLEVEQVRFDERLRYQIHSDSPDLMHCVIPAFLLQPLVENALKHGISRLAGQGLLEIRIRKDATRLEITIHDNGPPFPDNLTAGYGLQSTQDKLRLLCGDGARLELHNGPDKHVRIHVPVNPEAGAPEITPLTFQTDHVRTL